jgi:hypothetical protein
MTDRPILFSAAMIRALLDGRKTQTRRVVKPGPDGWFPIYQGGRRVGWSSPNATLSDDATSARYVPGDRLWVKETIRPQLLRHILTGEELPDHWAAAYDADGEDVFNGDGFNCVPWWSHGGKLSPIYMPRWASRITLTVTDVRVQRLQEISEADAVAEGVVPTWPDGIPIRHDGSGSVCVEAYRNLWNSLHGPAAWDANPWVYALTFTVHHGNIDAMMGGAA